MPINSKLRLVGYWRAYNGERILFTFLYEELLFTGFYSRKNLMKVRNTVANRSFIRGMCYFISLVYRLMGGQLAAYQHSELNGAWFLYCFGGFAV